MNQILILLSPIHSTKTSEPKSCLVCPTQGRLNLLKVVGAHLTNKTNFYGKKLNSYEQLIKVVGACAPSAPPGSTAYGPTVLLAYTPNFEMLS